MPQTVNWIVKMYVEYFHLIFALKWNKPLSFFSTGIRSWSPRAERDHSLPSSSEKENLFTNDTFIIIWGIIWFTSFKEHLFYSPIPGTCLLHLHFPSPRRNVFSHTNQDTIKQQSFGHTYNQYEFWMIAKFSQCRGNNMPVNDWTAMKQCWLDENGK